MNSSNFTRALTTQIKQKVFCNGKLGKPQKSIVFQLATETTTPVELGLRKITTLRPILNCSTSILTFRLTNSDKLTFNLTDALLETSECSIRTCS